jgi:hypothetical protein
LLTGGQIVRCGIHDREKDTDRTVTLRRKVSVKPLVLLEGAKFD